MSLHVLLQWSKQQQYTTLMGLKYLTYNMDAVTSLTYAQEYRSKTAGVLALQRKRHTCYVTYYLLLVTTSPGRMVSTLSVSVNLTLDSG